MSDVIANNKVVLITLSIFIAPSVTHLKTKDLQTTIINLMLTLLCGIPGIIHALYLALKA